MAGKWRGIFLLLVALLIAWLSLWLNDAWINRQKKAATEAKESKVSHYFTRFSLSSINPEGIVEYRLFGQHFSRWSGKDWSEILEPHLVTFSTDAADNNKEKQSTDMTAKKGIMRHEQDILELQKAVVIKDLSSDPISTLKTELLYYHPEKKWIDTDVQVTFTSDSSVLMGTGMDSKLDENILRIHSNVHSTFKTKK